MRYLILCTGNTCRSPMAEAILKQRKPDDEVLSAGMAAEDGAPASDNAVMAMSEAGLDISAHRAHQLTPELCREADRIFVMTPSHAVILHRHFGVPEERITVLGIPDPFGSDLEAYRACREAITAAFDGYFGKDGEQ